MNRLKILFLTPHLSTGGCPQYLLKKIKELKDEHDVYCVEYADITGGKLVVQRTQIKDILKERLITLGDNKDEFMTHLNSINPDILHLEELPEYFCDDNLSKQIYSKDRKYKIIETSHDSSFDTSKKRFFPDRFIFVSEYQKQLFSEINIPADIVEYPIEYKEKNNRDLSLRKLGLDPDKLHFLNIGLFTPRKNQSEVIQYAKNLLDENVQFHFIGNQADNFKWYWEPLMKEFPSNCKWWGERTDVDNFYNAMDFFLFSSKGTTTDKETNPLVVRESIGWNISTLMYNLPVYLGMYNKYKNIVWLDDNFQNNVTLIKKLLHGENIKQNFDDIFNVSFDKNGNSLTMGYKKKYKEFFGIVIKDIDSNASIYHCEWNCNPGTNYWIMPTPIKTYNFQEEPSFRGFKIELYNWQKQMVSEKEIYIKDIPLVRTLKLDVLDPFDCLFNNYNEMFVHKKYDCYKLDQYKTVIDIGANSGLFTKLCLEHGAEKVISVEPNKKCLKNLKHMFKNNENVFVIESGVSDKREKTIFYTTEKNSTIGSFEKSRVMNDYEESFVESSEINCITLEDIFNESKLDKVDLVKMDIEGAEYKIISSLTSETLSKINSFLIEYHDNQNGNLDNLISKLKNNGFEIIQMRSQNEKNNDDITNNYNDFKHGTIQLIRK